ncbi:MAG: Uncharacterized protein G01um101493_373, partial [Microgenomates group bacterium Gr01-1014_93]
MRQLLLHGPGISASRKKLSEIKQKFDPNNIVIFDPTTPSGQVMAALQTVPMFSEECLIIAENPTEDVANYPLSRITCALVFWFDHEIDPKKIGSLVSTFG